MTDFNDIRIQLAERRANGDFSALNKTATLAPVTFRVDSVSADGQQMRVTYSTGGSAVLLAPAVVSIQDA